MNIHLQTLSVPFEYPVVFTRDAFAVDNSALADVLTRAERRRQRVLVVIDRGVANAWPRLVADVSAYAQAHAPAMELARAPLVVEGGEVCKNEPHALAEMQRLLHQHGMDRQAFVVIVGGGALLDMVGYAAAEFHRGVRVVRVPTTVLAQGDSGVGVKTAINAYGIKNLIGVFAPPFAVINDASFLKTLEPRDVIAGMAEAVKVALIRDASFFEWIEAHLSELAAGQAAAVELLVERSALLHLEHIARSGDPFERTNARPLDFGHWAAHKLESLSRHRLRHGEAVAIGMLLDSRYALGRGLLGETAFARIYEVLVGLGLPTGDPALGERAPDGRRALVAGLEEFREHLGGELCLTMVTDVGRAVDVREVALDELERAIEWLERQCLKPKRSSAAE